MRELRWLLRTTAVVVGLANILSDGILAVAWGDGRFGGLALMQTVVLYFAAMVLVRKTPGGLEPSLSTPGAVAFFLASAVCVFFTLNTLGVHP